MELAFTIVLWIFVIATVTVLGHSFWMTYDLIKHDLNFDKEDKEDE